MLMERYLLDIVSGRRRGVAAALVRMLLALAELPYGAVIRLRNRLYDIRVLPSRALPRAAVSIGNLTTGGSGKTPLVCWLADQTMKAGRTPAVLMRGYKGSGGKSDEQMVIARAVPAMTVVADSNRRRGAAAAVAADFRIDLFLLDDAMQHRRARRDVEIVLIDAAQPWGWEHLLPRGLLREPVAGLKRADAVVITRSGQATPQQLAEIETTVQRYNHAAIVLSADHVLTGLISAEDVASPMSILAATPYIAACGIAQPESFVAGLRKHGSDCVGQKFFADHHRFTQADVSSLQAQARQAHARAIVVTEKDWVKLAVLPGARDAEIPFLRAQLSFQFADGDGRRLLELVLQRTNK
jgi:tetraacyldisaccharide 4'-kinase